VLVVDDVAWVRNVLFAGLSSDGFNVLLAGNAKQALELVQQPGTVRATLVDRRLPDMDGLELLAALRQLRPQIHCALMSGGATHSGVEEVAGLGKVFIFRKPFFLKDVARTLWLGLSEVGKS
jgi:DNA-binding NtrC family response regulator